MITTGTNTTTTISVVYENGHLSVYDGAACIISQPWQPDGTNSVPWDSEESAIAWLNIAYPDIITTDSAPTLKE